MERKLKTKAGKEMYKLRGQIVEAVFGQIKDCRRLGRFLLRGLAKVKGGFELWCLTHNLRKLYRADSLPSRTRKRLDRLGCPVKDDQGSMNARLGNLSGACRPGEKAAYEIVTQ